MDMVGDKKLLEQQKAILQVTPLIQQCELVSIAAM